MQKRYTYPLLLSWSFLHAMTDPSESEVSSAQLKALYKRTPERCPEQLDFASKQSTMPHK